MIFRTAGLLALLAIAWHPEAGAQETRKSWERDLITQEEILERAPDARTAYDVIKKLRPHFLRERSTGQVSGPMPAAGSYSKGSPAERQNSRSVITRMLPGFSRFICAARRMRCAWAVVSLASARSSGTPSG